MSDAIIKIYASQDWVENAIANIPEVDMSEYATETYVDDAISELSSQNGNGLPAISEATSGMFLTNDGTSASWVSIPTAEGVSF